MSENSPQSTSAAAHVERMQKSLESQPQWIYPKVFLNTPSTAFSFPDYPGLSVGLRYYIIVGKIGWKVTPQPLVNGGGEKKVKPRVLAVLPS